jgi:hypothetical protein
MECLLQSLTIDPVADPEGEIADDAGIVHVADCRVIQPAQGFRLS